MPNEIDQNKLASLKNAMQNIKKQYGDGAIMMMGDNAVDVNVDVIPTDILSLDIALGVYGIPKGRVIEIYGPESSGKTTLALQMIANAQKKGGLCAFIDAEHAMDPVYASAIGVDIDNLVLAQPDCGEQALEIVDQLASTCALDVIVVDSVAALVPKAEIDGDMSDAQIGLQARLMSKAMRKLTSNVSKSKTTLIFINQLREKVGVMFGNPEVTTGGRALKYYSSIRIEIRKTETLKTGTEMVGNRVKAKIVKNKVAPPFKEATFDIIFGKGISKESDLVDVAVNFNVITKSGSWFSYKDQRIGQGKDKVMDWLVTENMFDTIRAEVCDIINQNKAEALENALIGENNEG
jgi:recombination protein RecA